MLAMSGQVLAGATVADTIATFAAIQMHGRIEDFGPIPPLACAPLDAPAWEIARRVASIGLDEDGVLATCLTEFVDRLGETGVVSVEARAAMTRPTPLFYRALW